MSENAKDLRYSIWAAGAISGGVSLLALELGLFDRYVAHELVGTLFVAFGSAMYLGLFALFVSAREGRVATGILLGCAISAAVLSVALWLLRSALVAVELKRLTIIIVFLMLAIIGPAIAHILWQKGHHAP